MRATRSWDCRIKPISYHCGFRHSFARPASKACLPRGGRGRGQRGELMIKVEGLTKRYARTVAVDNISFEVEKGQIVGFLGPNGAGKTTTMRVLTCFMPPTAGTATVAGYDVLEQPAGGQEAHRLPARNAAPLPGHGGRRVSDLRRQAERASRGADLARRVDEVERTLHHRRRPDEAHRQALQRLPAARRTGAGDHPQPRRPDPRRADRRPRPQADHRDPRR